MYTKSSAFMTTFQRKERFLLADCYEDNQQLVIFCSDLQLESLLNRTKLRLCWLTSKTIHMGVKGINWHSKWPTFLMVTRATAPIGSPIGAMANMYCDTKLSAKSCLSTKFGKHICGSNFNKMCCKRKPPSFPLTAFPGPTCIRNSCTRFSKRKL